MGDLLGPPIDPKFPQYAYTMNDLTDVYAAEAGSKKVACMLMGEWVKLLDEDYAKPGKRRVRVAYRGGQGYVQLAALTRKRQLEVCFIDVGQGDAILIQTPDDRRILIDGGQGEDAHSFIASKYRLDKPDNYVDFEAVVATHCDEDHADGLCPILRDPKIAVKRVFHNGLFRRKAAGADPGAHAAGKVSGLEDRPSASDPSLKPFMKRFLDAIAAAEANFPAAVKSMRALPRWQDRLDTPPEGFTCKRLDASQGFLPPFAPGSQALGVEVLWPKATAVGGQACYGWYEDAGKTVNGNSVVLRLSHGSVSVLLAGDLNKRAMEDLRLACGTRGDGESVLRSDVYKAAHHGSQDFSVAFLSAVKPDAAVISSGDDASDKYGHPRAVLLGTATRYSRCETPAVFSTELAACFSALPPELQSKYEAGTGQLYERALRGIVHLRSNGEKLVMGTVHGRKPLQDIHAQTTWGWDVWPGHEP
jgi:beta-lactamase superfamily II metal-dependent hydrolase